MGKNDESYVTVGLATMTAGILANKRLNGLISLPLTPLVLFSSKFSPCVFKNSQFWWRTNEQAKGRTDGRTSEWTGRERYDICQSKLERGRNWEEGERWKNGRGKRRERYICVTFYFTTEPLKQWVRETAKYIVLNTASSSTSTQSDQQQRLHWDTLEYYCKG